MSALEDLERELDDATERARTLVDSTAPRLFTVRPDLSSWSAAECLAHLSISTEMFLPVLRGAIDEGRRRGLAATRKPRMDWLGAILRWFLEPPVRRRVRTSAPFVPRAVRARGEALSEFTSLQKKLRDLVAEARDLELGRLKVVSPFDRRVRYNVYSAFRIIIAHQRRHLWQAEQAVTALKRRKAA
ncbi:MAG TPA: DinB family protein [Thermoanaerobaculia bacterium]|nr:DinB family protein [Thermoanaerobaculia bacterium]